MKHTISSVPEKLHANFIRLESKYTEIVNFLHSHGYPNVTLKTSSDYRDPILNKQSGGAKNSQHLRAEAVDFSPENVSIHEIFDFIDKYKIELAIDQLILERDDKGNVWIHFSIADEGKRPRGESFFLKKGGKASKVNNIQLEFHEAKLSISGDDTPYDHDKPFLENVFANKKSQNTFMALQQTTNGDLKAKMVKSKLKPLITKATKNRGNAHA